MPILRVVVQAVELAAQAAELAAQVPALLRCKRIESKGVS